MPVLECFLFFLLGLILGSFLNVCIYRLPQGESVIWPGSYCPLCKHKIKPYDNLPLLSFLILQGKCRYCKGRISWRYPLVEAITGGLFAALYLKFGLGREIIIFLFLTPLLILITFIDIEFQLILNKITLPGVLLGALITWWFGGVSWYQIGMGWLLGGGVLIAIALLGKALFGRESMGMGDVKMAAMIGVFLGAKGITLALFFGFMIAGMFSFVGLALKKMIRTSYIPFGPFIAGGTFLYIFLGERIIHWYLVFSGLQ